MTVLCASGFVAVYLVADQTDVGQWADERLFQILYSEVPAGWPVAAAAVLARDVVIFPLAAACVVLGLRAIARGSVGVVVRSVAVTAVAVTVSPRLRDEVLTRQSFTLETYPWNSMPSTHATAAAALVVAVVVMWPQERPTWLLNVGGVVLGLVALGNVVGQAHRPSDVVGSYLLVAGALSASYVVTGDRSVDDGPAS